MVITLDKVKMVLQQVAGQPQTPCLYPLPEAEAEEHLWGGPRSLARRVLRSCMSVTAPAAAAKAFSAAQVGWGSEGGAGWVGAAGAARGGWAVWHSCMASMASAEALPLPRS